MSDADKLIAGNTNERKFGLYRAIVIDNVDPMSRGRVKISLPSVFGAEGPPEWAEACLPAQALDGQLPEFLPQVGAGVWIAFEGGDISRPVWIGILPPVTE